MNRILIQRSIEYINKEIKSNERQIEHFEHFQTGTGKDLHVLKDQLDLLEAALRVLNKAMVL